MALWISFVIVPSTFAGGKCFLAYLFKKCNMQSKIQFDLRQYTECTCMYCNIFVTVSKKSTIMININHHHPRSYNELKDSRWAWMINTFFNSDNSERGIPQLKGNPKKEGTGEMNDPNEKNFLTFGKVDIKRATTQRYRYV